MIEIHQSNLSEYLECPRKFKLINVDGIKKPETLRMKIGTYGHAMIEAQRKGQKSWKTTCKVSAWEKEIINSILSILVPAYFAFWSKTETKAKHNPEGDFHVVIRGMELGGRIDDIVEDEISDLKFKGRIDDENIALRLPLDIQGRMYCFVKGLRSFTLDMIKVPTIKDGADPKDIFDKLQKDMQKNPEAFFSRQRVVYSGKDIIDFEEWLKRQYIKIDDAFELDSFDPNYSSCWRCDFLRYCSSGCADISGLETKKKGR